MAFQQKIKRLFSGKNLIIIGIIIIIAVFLPYLLRGEDSHIRVHDNLDSNVVWVKMILDQGGIFMPPTAIVEQPMNGLPHSSIYGAYDISLVFFYFFGTFWGYILNKFLMALIGFWGMYLLLKKHLLPQNTLNYISIGVALCFGLLPFWSFTASVAGLPFILYAFLNIRQKDINISNWLIIIFYGLYSSLVLTGVFFLIIMSFLVIYDLIKKKSINLYLIGAIVLLSGVYIINHLPLFISHFSQDGYISHRTDFKSRFHNPTKIIVKHILAMLRKGDGDHLSLSHAISLHKFIVIPVILAILLMIKQKIKDKRFIYISVLIILTSCLFGLVEWDDLAPARDKLYSVFPLDLRRFYWLLPLWWYILLGLSLVYISKYVKYGQYVIIAFLLFQLSYVFKNQDYFISKNLPTYKEFFAKQQFDDIKSFIDKDVKTYRIISIGIHPSISQYNGFYTLDGFSPDYPLKYKQEFGKVINGEIEKSKELYEMFTCWGSWCYAFSAEVGLKPYKDCNNDFPIIEHLDYNYDALMQMGGKYILSAAEIDPGNNKNIRLMKLFSQSDYGKGSTNWDIYLYEILPQPSPLENDTRTEPIDNNT